MNNKAFKKVSIISLAAMMSVSLIDKSMFQVSANSELNSRMVDAEGYNVLGSVKGVDTDTNKVTLDISTGEKVRFSFLDQNVFRLYMAPQGEEFKDYPTPNSKDHTATITNKTDAQYEAENKVRPVVVDNEGKITISTEKVTIEINKETSMIKVMKADGSVVWEESAPLKYKTGNTIQTLKTNKDEYFYGGGTQNGYFSHKGKKVNIAVTNTWVDQSVASPNPFYWSTDGYGVVRNTWKPGSYDFGSKNADTVETTHNEKRFDAYYFIDDGAEALLGDYYDLTGKPAELPEYASYLGHLNCYNRDFWVPSTPNTGVKLGDNWYKESQSDNGGKKETLLGESETTAQQIIEDHEKNDMPLGWFLPNDGYGCGYGQEETQAGDLQNLKDFADYAKDKGIQTGLWTQSNLWPADPTNPKKGERDIYKEVESGVHSLKTDVAWVGDGYSMAMNGVSIGYDAIASRSNLKPNIVTLNGWAGTQRYGGIWSGDQYGGKWEYIRFHIPTYIGTGLSGQPNVGSDMDGIFGGGNELVQTRDFQWKAFSTFMLDMDGWGSNQKSPYAFGEDSTSINRTYLKLKAQLAPYINTVSHEATAEGGLPMLRAMFLEEENTYTLGTKTQYQYMWGDDFLVAPIYQETAVDEEGNDIRNDIYLPGTSDVWTDYFTGKQYRGGQILNNFDAPVWKLPVFVKNGAIIPMYPENNNPEAITEDNPKGLDRSQRIIEFYPDGASEYELYEDDGKTLGGASSTTMISSNVDGDTLTLSNEKTVGLYSGMVKERSTEFIVNASKAPNSVVGTVAGEDVVFTPVGSKEAYDNATIGNVYYYDPAPSVIIKDYATKDSKYASIDETTAPKLFIKSTDKVDITANALSVTVEGFENKQDLGEDIVDATVAVPTGLNAKDVTSKLIQLGWDTVENAASYDVEIDGDVYRNITINEFTSDTLQFLTDYTYRVRSVMPNGHYSEWSAPITVQTLDDPYRNVPEPVVDWAYGDQHGKLAGGFDHNSESMFHSTNAVTPDQMMTIDLEKAYDLDKFTYLPRTDHDGNAGNGKVQRMDVYASLDGINYTKVWDGAAEDAWDYTGQKGEEMLRTINLDGVKARYLRISVLKSNGGFFAAAEMTTYKKDGTNGWLVGDVNNSGSIEENDLTFYENYVGLKQSDKDWNYANGLGNINRDDIIDAYDISYVARQLGEKVDDKKAAKGVEGKIEIIPSKTDIKKGDLITLDYYGINMKNVNAFSVELPVDQDLFEVVNFGSPALKSMFMKNFSKTRFHNDGKTDNYVVFTNMGTQDLLNGTGNIAKVTIRANKDFTWDTKATRATVVGQDLSSADAMINPTEVPTLPETESVLGKADMAAMTFKNDVKEDIAGSDLFQQSNWADLLFDGDKTGALVEFKWFTDTQIPADYVKVPTDMTFKFKKSQPLKTVRVYNRASSNGQIKKIKAVGYDGDTAYELGSFSSAEKVFEFNVPEAASKIDRVVITPEATNGTATAAEEGKKENRMLSIYEIEFATSTKVNATGINFDSKAPTTAYANTLTQIKANVTPTNVSNPFYALTSSDESIAKVVKIPTEKEYVYCIQGIKPGKVTVTATSEDGSFTAEHEIEIIGGVNTTVLNEQLKEFDGLYKNLYTTKSYDDVKVIAEEARELVKNPDVTQDKVDTITLKLAEALNKLEFKGSNADQPTSEDLIPTTNFAMYDESSFTQGEQEHATNVFDGKLNTIWHSNYSAGYTLPQWVTIDLGANYDLEQVDYYARQSGHNGHITHYRVEVAKDQSDRTGELEFTPVVEGYLSNDGQSLDSPDEAKEIKFDKTTARYVRFIALESLGDRNNAYASIAELNFFGKKALINPANALAEAEKMLEKEEIMTTSSFTTFMDAYRALRDVNEEASDAELQVLAINLYNAIDKLERKAPAGVISTLEELVAETKALEADYTKEEFADVKAAITVAEAILAKDANDITATEANLATINLAEARSELNQFDNDRLMASLVKQVEIANNILNDESIHDKRPANVQALRDAVAAAQELIDANNNDHEAIKTAMSNITKAANELYAIVNKDDLSEVINRVALLNKNDYSAETWAELMSAYATAKSVAANDDATTEEVANAYKNLINAIKHLAPSIDKTALVAQIEEAQSIIDNKDAYIAATIDGLEALLTEAKELNDNADASQKAIDNMSDALTKATMRARLKADRTKLEAVVSEARNMDLTMYSADSVMALTNALDNAEAMMKDEYADQESLDAMTAAVEEAMKGLVKNTDKPNVTVPEAPSTGTDADKGTDSVSKPDTDSTNKKAPSKTTGTIAKTGDATNAMGLAGIGAAAGAVLVFMRKKFKNKK